MSLRTCAGLLNLLVLKIKWWSEQNSWGWISVFSYITVSPACCSEHVHIVAPVSHITVMEQQFSRLMLARVFVLSLLLSFSFSSFLPHFSALFHALSGIVPVLLLIHSCRLPAPPLIFQNSDSVHDASPLWIWPAHTNTYNQRQVSWLHLSGCRWETEWKT